DLAAARDLARSDVTASPDLAPVDLALPPRCDDGFRDGDETDVDCGGTCAACADGLGCLHGGDCRSRSCVAGACAAPSCTDGIQNGAETDVDCGGPSGQGAGQGAADS